MANMTERMTFAFDKKTRRRIQYLAKKWNISQSEAVRRAVEESMDRVNLQIDPLAALRAFHSQGGLDSKTASTHLAEISAARREWRSE